MMSPTTISGLQKIKRTTGYSRYKKIQKILVLCYPQVVVCNVITQRYKISTKIRVIRSLKRDWSQECVNSF